MKHVSISLAKAARALGLLPPSYLDPRAGGHKEGPDGQWYEILANRCGRTARLVCATGGGSSKTAMIDKAIAEIKDWCPRLQISTMTDRSGIVIHADDGAHQIKFFGENATIELGLAFADVTFDHHARRIEKIEILPLADRYPAPVPGAGRVYSAEEIARLQAASRQARDIVAGKPDPTQVKFTGAKVPLVTAAKRRGIVHDLTALACHEQEDSEGRVKLSPLAWRDGVAARKFGLAESQVAEIRESIGIDLISATDAEDAAAATLDEAIRAYDATNSHCAQFEPAAQKLREAGRAYLTARALLACRGA